MLSIKRVTPAIQKSVHDNPCFAQNLAMNDSHFLECEVQEKAGDVIELLNFFSMSLIWISHKLITILQKASHMFVLTFFTLFSFAAAIFYSPRTPANHRLTNEQPFFSIRLRLMLIWALTLFYYHRRRLQHAVWLSIIYGSTRWFPFDR